MKLNEIKEERRKGTYAAVHFSFMVVDIFFFL